MLLLQNQLLLVMELSFLNMGIMLHILSVNIRLAVNLKDSVSYQTKNSYNGSTITVGGTDDTDTLTLGIIREGDSRLLKGAIYYFALYNKSLTPEEIETEKERLDEEWLKRKTE